MTRFTVSLSPELHEQIRRRAEHNVRSMSGEITHLIECALAAELEGNITILRTLMKAQGGPRPAS